MKFLNGAVILAFCSTAIASSEYSFDQALKLIMDRHSLVKEQEATVESADWTVFSKKMNYLPKISVSGSEAYSSGSNPTPSLGVTASLNLFKWGADAAAVSAAKNDLGFQKNTLASVSLISEQEAVDTLVGLIEKSLNFSILSKKVEAYKTYWDIANQRYHRGLLPLQEADKVSVDLANAEARLTDGETQLAQAQANLEKLLGDGSVMVNWPWKQKLASLNGELLNKINFNAEQRPDVKANEELLAAEESRLDANRDSIYPSLKFTASYSPPVTFGVPPTPVGSTIYLTLEMPLFNAFQDYASYKTQYQSYLIQDFKLRQLKIDAQAEWQAIRRSLIVALSTALAREKNLQTSQRIFEANLSRFKQGRATANDLAVDQDRFIEAQLLAVQGWKNAHSLYASFCHALGKSVSSCLN